MRRGDFENLVRRHLDAALVPRASPLIPHPPEDGDDAHPRAVYEAGRGGFDRRYPALAVGGDPPCIDLWIELNPSTGRISSTLNGPSVEEVSKRLGLTRPSMSGSHGMDVGLQLTDLGARLCDVLDAAKRYILPERLRTK